MKSNKKTKVDSKTSPHTWLQLAQLRSEKCELAEAEEAYLTALQISKNLKDFQSRMEALSGLLRLAAESLDEDAVKKWDRELDLMISSHPHEVPPMVWYCKGAVARHHRDLILSQRYFHRYLRAVKTNPSATYGSEESIAKGWAMIAVLFQQQGKLKRAERLANKVLQFFESNNYRSVNGTLYLLLGTLAERRQDLQLAMRWYQRAHTQFLGEHNWYSHLYVLFGYARIARLQKNYLQAHWYIELIERSIGTAEFGSLRREVTLEKARLEKEAVDLLIDSRKGLIKTRESGQVSLKKQYVLLHILEALTGAHEKSGSDMERGLSKAEIIEYVWKEAYRPEVHDNKLYYNINRLRKLIEPNVKKPQYLLNWKEGYRLAPSLRIHYVGERSSNTRGEMG